MTVQNDEASTRNGFSLEKLYQVTNILKWQVSTYHFELFVESLFQAEWNYVKNITVNIRKKDDQKNWKYLKTKNQGLYQFSKNTEKSAYIYCRLAGIPGYIQVVDKRLS